MQALHKYIRQAWLLISHDVCLAFLSLTLYNPLTNI